MRRLRLALIHALGGVEKPLPMTHPGVYPATYSTSGVTGVTSYYVTWPPASPKRKRWWQ